ncbi:MAG: hypothetical protein JO002_03475 [Burkholderiaceae bacterium]|nr:hypothetical protein [Burkholderiaceae bacterium]
MLLVLLVNAAWAGDAKDPAWVGIWRGTVGQNQVMVCLDRTDDEGTSPSRYYVSGQSGNIALAAKDAAGTAWTEGDAPGAAQWQIDTAANDGLQGRWISPDQQGQTFTLHRVAAQADPESAGWWGKRPLCRSISFYGPRADAEQLVAGEPQGEAGRHYREVYAGSYYSDKARKEGLGQRASFIELLGNDSRIVPINRALRERWHVRLARTYIGENGGLAEVAERVDLFTARWLTLSEWEWFDGYGASGISMWHETWDLNTGRKIDPWSWFNKKGGHWKTANGAVEAGAGFEPSKTLNRIAQRYAVPDDECKDGLWLRDPRPTQKGLVFSTGYGPCLNEFTVPFRDLRPLLTEDGLREARLFSAMKR